MVLRELDVDITPVLTGAGIVGLAIGFGAQTLVKDIISGFFLIVEDQVRVGDVAVVNGIGGPVEEINLRTIVLRDLEGVVHIISNGEIRTLANRTQDFAYSVIDLGVGYDDDTDRLSRRCARGRELMADPAFAAEHPRADRSPGRGRLQGAEVTMRFRIKTLPLKQWEVGRELQAADQEGVRRRGIKMPSPQMKVTLKKAES